MKLSVSLPDEDVDFLDAFAEAHAMGSRSAALRQAVRALRQSGLADAYTDAWADWAHDRDAGAWESTAGDGI